MSTLESPPPTTAQIQVRRVAGALGAEVLGVDLGALDDRTFTAIEAALAEHLVLFFPGWAPSLEEQRDFAARFGPLEVHPVLAKVDEAVPEVVLIDGGIRADTWHTDVTWSAHPPIASVFHLVDGPDHAGDTMWTNMEQAFAELSAPMQELCLGLTATHAGALFGLPHETAVHPVVRRHPVIGRPALYVNRTWTSHINELTPAESVALLAMLYAHSEQPHLTVRRHWAPGEVCVWDNRSTMHVAVNDYGDAPRRVHRVTVLGDDPQPAGELRWPEHTDAIFSVRTGMGLVQRSARPAPR